VVFVRKRLPEIQHLHATISESQREDYGLLVQEAIRLIEAAQFPQHSGIRFPQNQCVSCPFFGLCLNNQELVEARLARRTGVDLGLLDQLIH
jgi:hypothetical protein